MNLVVGYLIDALETAKIWQNLNLIIVSDHGMTNLKEDEFISLNDYLDIDLIDQDKTFCAEIGNIHPNSNKNVYFRLN